MTIKATNNNCWVVRDIPESEKNGIFIPDAAKPKVHRGKIITVGKLVSDDTIKPGRVAIFNKSSGFEIPEEGIEYTILRQDEIIGTDDSK
jgi:chaperonin GroES